MCGTNKKLGFPVRGWALANRPFAVNAPITEVQSFGELDHYLNHMWQGSWLLQDHQQSKISKVMIFFITHWLLVVNWIYRNNTISFRLITRQHKINLQHYSCSWNLWTLRRVLSWVLKKMRRKSNKN